MHLVCKSVPAAELKVTVLLGVTVIEPVVAIEPHPPDNVTVYVNDPETEGDPLMVTTLEAHDPVTPVGNPVTVAPVAPVVA